VLASATSRLAGPAACTGEANGAVVYDSPWGSASAMSVRVGESLKTPRIDVLYGSVAVDSDPTAGYASVAAAGVPNPSVPSLIDVAVPLRWADGYSVAHVVPGRGQSAPAVVT
jgi:hypothetical protein